MKRSDTRILTTHVGSLVRPKELLDLAKSAGRTSEEYKKRLAAEVEAIVKKQVEVGVDIVNDGEFGKSSWANYSLERLGGFELRPDMIMPPNMMGRDRDRFAEFMKENFPRGYYGIAGHACVEAVTYKDKDSVKRDVANLKAAVAKAKPVEGFLTAVAPASIGYDAIDEHYRDEKKYVFAIAEAMREEYRAIADAGLVLQVDDAVLANMYDHYVQQSPEKFRQWAQLRIDALNHALEGIPASQVRYHICFGSWHVPHVADAPLEAIVDLITQVKAGGYSIEAANVRHEHEWRVWEKVKLPKDTVLLPGVVTHHTTTVEHPELVAERIVRFAKIVGRENVIASTDCGFAQMELIARVHPEVMWAKLESLVEGARLASKTLWG